MTHIDVPVRLALRIRSRRRARPIRPPLGDPWILASNDPFTDGVMASICVKAGVNMSVDCD